MNYVSAKCIFLSAFIRGVNAVVQIPGPGPGRHPPHPREDAGHPSRVPDLVPGAILRRVSRRAGDVLGGPSGGDRDGRVGRRLGDRPRWRERWTRCGLRFARLCPGPPQAPGAPALPSARPHAAARLAPGWGGGSPRVLCRQGCDRESVSPAPGGERAQRVDGEGKATRLCVCGGRGLSPGGVIVTVGHLGAGRGDMEGRPGQREKARLPT